MTEAEPREENTPTSTYQLTSLRRAIGRRFSLPALIAVLIWGVNVSTMKMTVAEIDPYLVGILRMGVAGLILLAVVWRVEGGMGIESHHWPRLLFVSCVGTGLSSTLWAVGLSLGTATNAALISNISPVFALIMAVALGQEKLLKERVIGSAVALAGVALVVQTDGLELRGSALLGDVFLLGNAVAWASYNVFGVALLKRYSPMRVTAWAMTLGAIALALASPLLVRNWDLSQVSYVGWGGLFYAVVFASMIAQTLWSRAMHALGASGVMVYNYLNPVLGVGFASLLLGERFTLMQAVGAVFVLGGVTVSTQAGPKRARPRLREREASEA